MGIKKEQIDRLKMAALKSQVLILMARGLSIDEIAKKLSLEESMIKQLFKK